MDYRLEIIRLNSFQDWPVSYIRPEDLAVAGFYYTKHLDRVKCFECSIEIFKWEEGDNPNTEHQRWGARCRFIRKLPCGNVPIGVDPSTVPLPRARSFDVCGPYGLEYRLDAEADTYSGPSTLNSETSDGTGYNVDNAQLSIATMLGCLGISITSRPDFPEYASYEARLQSFIQWTTSIVQTKEQLADAGFFYTNVKDKTTCYHCGGSLENWESIKDDPWQQHAKWFSKCRYVLLIKGQEFINNVTGKNVTPLSEKQTKKINLPSCIKRVEAIAPSSKLNERKQETNSEESSRNLKKIKNGQLDKETVVSLCSTSEVSHDKPIDDTRSCKICYNDDLGIIFLPCGHIVACVKCAIGMTSCALCRKPVTMTARAFLS